MYNDVHFVVKEKNKTQVIIIKIKIVGDIGGKRVVFGRRHEVDLGDS